MDYYSGTPDIDNYDYNNGGNYGNSGNGRNNFFKNNSVLILICVGIAIVILIFMFLFSSPSNKKDYNTLDKDSSLSKLDVYGGDINPNFSKDVIKYTIEATSPNISFDCKASSSKAKVEGCDKSVEVTDGKVQYNIKVTAEDGNITRYYFTIIKSANFIE